MLNVIQYKIPNLELRVKGYVRQEFWHPEWDDFTPWLIGLPVHIMNGWQIWFSRIPHNHTLVIIGYQPNINQIFVDGYMHVNELRIKDNDFDVGFYNDRDKKHFMVAPTNILEV